MFFYKKNTYYKAIITNLLLLLYSTALLAQNPVGERKIIVISNTEILVEIKITKNNITGFGKIEETIPEGFTTKAEEKANSVYSFIDGKVKFLWLELPTAPTLQVSYKLNGENASTTNLTGNFSYLINDESLKIEINTVTQLQENSATTIEFTQENKYNTTTDSSSSTIKPEANNKITTENNFPETSIFKVQIGAYKNEKWKQNYSNITNLSSDKTDEFTRFYSGSFKTLQEAENHQKELIKKGYTQNFIIYFVGSTRFTLPEN